MTDITELAQREKFEAWFKSSFHPDNTGPYIKDQLYFAWKAAGAELVEALESEKRICATWRKTAESTSEKLEKAQAAERRWHRVASRVHEQACESDVKIDELEAIRAAAEKLVRCKGRYHSEQNYRALAALFGVTTPDLPPLDSESSAVTVKLTDINEYLAEVHDKTLNRAFRLLAEGVRAGDVAAMRAAGIKVEDE
ncbi:hypothetical protein AAHW68_19945 [Klebsiella pneumoniae]